MATKPVFLAQKLTVRSGTPIEYASVIQHVGNLVEFPASPQACSRRKRGVEPDLQKQHPIISYYPNILPATAMDIYADWLRGVRIAWLAKIYQRTVAQIEAVNWVAGHFGITPGGATLMPSCLDQVLRMEADWRRRRERDAVRGMAA